MCAHPACMSPWLNWHHFDPPFREEKHHRPKGLIGLCADHAQAADGEAYSVEQLREWKSRGRGEKDVQGFFEWLHAGLAIVMGRCIFPGATVALALRGQPAIWLERSLSGPLVLNVRMPTVTGEPRLGVYHNWFLAADTPEGMILRCPPIGHRRIEVEYEVGDRFAIEFTRMSGLPAVKIELAVPAAGIEIDSSAIRVGGFSQSAVFVSAPVGLALGGSPPPYAAVRTAEEELPENLTLALWPFEQ